VLVSINPDSLLLEAARRVDEWSLIEKKIPSLDLVFEVDRPRVMDTFSELTPEQQRIVALLDGTHNVQEIADETGLSEFDAGKALFGLIQAGFAHRVGRKTDPEGARSKEAEIAERRNLGVAFYRTAMLDDAVREFQRLLELSPGDLQASYHLALIALRERKFRDAIRQFKAILESTGPHFGAFVNLAVALRALKRPEDAILVLGEADQLRPGTPIVALTRGVALLEAGQFNEAAASLKEYRTRVPAGEKPAAMYYYYGALAAALRKHLNEAETLIREGEAQHPDVAPISLMVGLVAERRGDYDYAERFFREVIEEDPTLFFAHKNLGDVVYRRGEHEAALEHYQRAMQLNPNLGDDTCAKVGNIYYKLRERDEALRFWARALELNPNNQVVRNNIDIVQNAG
jgi:tetratricopeptide (TPR) repeat protein